MVAITAPVDGKRWAGVSQTRKPGAKSPKPINMPSQRGTATWDDKSTLPASNAWASPWLLYPKNDGASGSPSHIDNRPSSQGSSTSSSTIGSDFLDLPSYHLPTAVNGPLSTEKRSGSVQLSCFQDSFTNVLKVPLKAVGRRAPKSQGKGFSPSMDDFPVLGSKNSVSNSEQVSGKISGRWPTIGSGIVAIQDKQGNNPITGTGEVIYEDEIISRMDYDCKGGDPIPAAKLARGAEQAQLHDPQVPNMCKPPPWLDDWQRPPYQPPDDNGILHHEEVSYGRYMHADPTGFAVETLAHRDQFALTEEALAKLDTGHRRYYPDKRDISHAHMPADCCVINQSCHVLGKVKNGHADVLEIKKQPIIKKDVALLEKIKCLNNKARNFRALNLASLPSSLHKDCKVKHPKTNSVEEDPARKYVLFSASTSESGPAFGRLNCVSQSSNSVPTNPSNGPDKGVTVICLSEKQVTEFGVAGKVGKSDCHAYGRSNISRNMLDGSAQGMPYSITGYGCEEHSMVDSVQVLMVDAQQDQLFSRNTSQEPHVTVTDKVPNWLDCEDQHSRMRCLSAQAAKQLQNAENWISQQNTNAIAKLEELRRYQSTQSQKSNREIRADMNGAEAKYHDDLLTRNKSSRKDIDSVRPAAPPVFNEKNSTEVPSRQKTHVPCIAINSSTIPPNVTSVTGLIVGNIMLDDVPLASVNQEWAVPAKQVHYTASSLSKPCQVKKSEKNQHGVLPVDTPVLNDSVMCKLIEQTGRKEEHAEGGPTGMAVAVAIESSGSHSMSLVNVATAKKMEMRWYAHKPVYEELQQQNLGPILPGENFNVADVIQGSSDQWQQGVEQFESKAHRCTEDHSTLTEMVSLPDNTWEKYREADSPRRYHVEAERNVGSHYGYRERAGRGRFFHESPAPYRDRWMPKDISHPRSDAQDDGVSKWLQDSHQVLLDMNNSQPLDSKLTQIADRDAGMDLQGGEGNIGMSFRDENNLIWNEAEWEYQHVFPAPHSLGQQHGGDPSDDSQRGRGRHSGYHYPEVARCRDATPDIQWNPGGADNHQYPASSRAGMHMERRYYI